MKRTLLHLLLLTSAALSGCASPPPPDPTMPAHNLRIAGDDVTVSFAELPLGEFLKLAQEVTEEVYTFDSRQAATVEPLSLQGEVHCKRADFGEFVQTTLYLRGKCVRVRDAGGLRVLEVVPLAHSMGS